MRCSPSGVHGPVLAPPCILHLPFGIAGPLQAMLILVRAPQRGVACARGMGKQQTRQQIELAAKRA
jgi:hypothetical protein